VIAPATYYDEFVLLKGFQRGTGIQGITFNHKVVKKERSGAEVSVSSQMAC